MLRIEEIVGAMDDEFRYALDAMDSERLEALVENKAALRRLRPVGVSNAEAIAMITAILQRRAAPPPAKPRKPRRRAKKAAPPPPPAEPAPALQAILPPPLPLPRLARPRATGPAIRLGPPPRATEPAIRLGPPPRATTAIAMPAPRAANPPKRLWPLGVLLLAVAAAALILL